MLFKDCTQSLIALVLIIITYPILFSVRGGFGMFLDWEKYNWIYDLLSVIIYLGLIQVLCATKHKTIAWILIGITVVGLIFAIFNRTTVLAIDMKIVDIEKKDNVGLFKANKIVAHQLAEQGLAKFDHAFINSHQ